MQEHVLSLSRHSWPKRLMLTALLPVLFVGCGRCVLCRPAQSQHYYLSPQKQLCSIGTVALVELQNESAYPQISTDVSEALYQALQKKHLFGLSVIRSNDSRWKNLQIRPGSPYTLDQLLATRKILDADTVLIGTVTGYQPYPHMSIALRLKLIDLNDGELVWAIEQVWDTADRTTQARMKTYFDRQKHKEFAPVAEKLARISPINFVQFVAWEVAETLGKDN